MTAGFGGPQTSWIEPRFSTPQQVLGWSPARQSLGVHLQIQHREPVAS